MKAEGRGREGGRRRVGQRGRRRVEHLGHRQRFLLGVTVSMQHKA